MGHRSVATSDVDDVVRADDEDDKGAKKRRQRANIQASFSLRRLLLSSNPLVTQAQPLFEPPASNRRRSRKAKVSNNSDSNVVDEFAVVRSRKDSQGNMVYECPLCLDWHDDLRKLVECGHRVCHCCMQHYVRIELQECRVNVKCPICDLPLHPNDVESSLGSDGGSLLKLYEMLTLRRTLSSDPDARFCPGPNCNYAVIASGCASCPRISCQNPACGIEFCYHCKAQWHPDQTCDAARAQRGSSDGSGPPTSRSRGRRRSSSQHSSLGGVEVKVCPKCHIMIVKMDDGSCNHMTCSVCGAEFCWLCMKEISDLHYLSPSGCTFWGKKPWSRKKKLFCQLGTLAFAPVGIALLAGISIPAMLIGIPVWVGRKLHAKYKKSSKKRRNFIISLGVITSVLVSPFMALFVVGIGVPILLAYVYCVVPVSLCRSQGCGVSTDRRGVKIEVDEEQPNTHDEVTYTHFRQTNTSVANPSIGEVSVGASLSLGSALDGVEANWDHDSASHTAIAGQSLTGSVSGVSAASSFYTRSKLVVELSADVHQLPSLTPNNQHGNGGSAMRKKFSLSSERLSNDDSSNAGSNNVDSSTRALAGSMQSNKFVLPRAHRHRTDCNHHQADAISLRSMPAATTTTNFRSLSPVDVSDVVVIGPSRRSRITKHLDRQWSESSSLLTAEDAVSERVRFDDHVDFIDETKDDDQFSNEGLERTKEQLEAVKNPATSSGPLPEETAEELALVSSPVLSSSSSSSTAVEPPEAFRTEDL